MCDIPANISQRHTCPALSPWAPTLQEDMDRWMDGSDGQREGGREGGGRDEQVGGWVDSLMVS